jgi:hypothetical protein
LRLAGSDEVPVNAAPVDPAEHRPGGHLGDPFAAKAAPASRIGSASADCRSRSAVVAHARRPERRARAPVLPRTSGSVRHATISRFSSSGQWRRLPPACLVSAKREADASRSQPSMAASLNVHDHHQKAALTGRVTLGGRSRSSTVVPSVAVTLAVRT